MLPVSIPSGTIVTAPQPLTRQLMEQILSELCDPGDDFTGFIAVTSDHDLYLLFFYKSHPYSAGKSLGKDPSSLSIRDYFREVVTLMDGDSTVSVHATDPVLLKCLLVFMHDDLTAKAPTSLINLEAILGQIRQDATDALILLEKHGMFNFFFFKDGIKGRSYYADSDAGRDEGLTVDEQLLIYAFQSGEVDALIYRNVTTFEAKDAASTGLDDMLKLLQGESGNRKSEGVLPDPEVAEVIEEHLILSVLDGPRAGETVTGPIPCVLGRKNTDIVMPDPMVSKTHAAIQVVNGKLLLIDLNSTNGTTVNGQQIRQHEIVVGDIIGMGNIHLKVLRVTLP